MSSTISIEKTAALSSPMPITMKTAAGIDCKTPWLFIAMFFLMGLNTKKYTKGIKARNGKNSMKGFPPEPAAYAWLAVPIKQRKRATNNLFMRRPPLPGSGTPQMVCRSSARSLDFVSISSVACCRLGALFIGSFACVWIRPRLFLIAMDRPSQA